MKSKYEWADELKKAIDNGDFTNGNLSMSDFIHDVQEDAKDNQTGGDRK